MNVNLTCTKIDFNGFGTVTFKNKSYLVKGLLLNEEATIDITEGKKYAQLVKIISASDKRISPICPKSKECGGCQYLHMSYDEELRIKNEYMKELFQNINGGKISDINGMHDPYYYRNKCQMVYKLSKTRKVVCGFYEEHTHNIVSVTDCKLHAKTATKIINSFNEVLTKHKIEPFDERTNSGVIKHVLVRYGFQTKEIMLVIVTNGEMFPGRNNVLKDLLKLDLGITTIVQNYNPRETSIVLGEKERILYGPGFIYDIIGDYKFKISSKSFYQVNAVGMKHLYNRAIELANIKNTDLVLDTYCGVGTLSIFASKYAREVIGVELNKDAIKDAIINSKINQIKNINFINDDSTKFMQKLAINRQTIDVLILDPPRLGSTEQFINTLKILKPKTVVYVSCEPTTLKRDLYTFFENDYEITNFETFDMFPRTSNIESIVVLKRNEE